MLPITGTKKPGELTLKHKLCRKEEHSMAQAINAQIKGFVLYGFIFPTELLKL